MTSIIAPWAHAANLATQAQERLATAANLLRSDAPGPFEPTPITIGIPEQNGPDSPDNPWFVSPKPIMPPYVPNNGAIRLAGGAVTAIDQALSMRTSLSSGVVTAFERAKAEAIAGVRLLESPEGTPVDKRRVPLSFDAAGMWLGLAKNLLALDHDLPTTRPTHPPVAIKPGEPGSPITIQPIMPAA